MKDQFKAKTWIYRAQFLICGFLALLMIPLGIGFWTGAMTNAAGDKETSAGLPMVCTGTFLAIVAVMALVNLIGRRKPVLRCFREGIECTLVGGSGPAYLPRRMRLFYTILSGKGFQTRVFRVDWPAFTGASVDGVTMMYRLILNGDWVNLKTFESVEGLTLPQVLFVDSPQEIAEMLNRWRRDAADQTKLKSWPKIGG